MASWLGPRLLADRLPILRGRATTTVGSNVPDGVKLTVPRFTVERGRTVDLLPLTEDAALARHGQQLDVTLEVAGVDTRVGRFLITDWDYDEETILVTGAGLLQIPADDRLIETLSPRTGGTQRSEFIRLLSNGLGVQFAPGLVDRVVPDSMVWEEDRLADLYTIADGWPAVIRMDPWGQVVVKPPPVAAGTPVLSLTDGVGGTVVRVPRQDSRKGAYNIVVVRSSADGVVASGIAQATSGPMAVATYNPVPRFYSNPTLTTDAECTAVAQAMLPASMRASSILAVEMAPDPRLELDDYVEIRHDGRRDWGLVVGLDIPLTVADGPMRVDVGVL